MSKPSLSVRVVGTFVLAVLGGCGGPPPGRLDGAVDESCRVLAAAESADTVVIALFEAVDPAYAPWGHNAGEQLVFAHLYETLIAVDCDGEVRPGLAESWRREGDGRRWLFRLSRAARFWDGWRVTPRDVVQGWQDALTLGTLVDSVSVAGERAVRVYVRQPARKVPLVLAAPAFAVARPSTVSPWPVGTGPYRVEADGYGGARGRGGWWLHPTSGVGPVIRFLTGGRRDPRDLLERGVDLLVTSDRAVIEYAASVPRWTAVALPWSRVYVLLSTSRVAALRRGEAVGMLGADLVAALARDAVRGDARGHAPPSWWDDLDTCMDPWDAIAPPVPDPGAARRIVYDAADPVARDLAERLVALAAAGQAMSPESAAIAAAVPGIADASPPVVAAALGTRALASSLRAGDDFAYVVALPVLTPIPCYEALTLARRAPWLVARTSALGEALVTLVDTRAHAIVASRGFDLVADGYGHLRIVAGEPAPGGRP